MTVGVTKQPQRSADGNVGVRSSPQPTVLMRLAHLFNTLARYAHHLRDLYRQLGVRGALAFIRASCAGPWFDPTRMRHLLAQPLQLQLE